MRLHAVETFKGKGIQAPKSLKGVAGVQTHVATSLEDESIERYSCVMSQIDVSMEQNIITLAERSTYALFSPHSS